MHSDGNAGYLGSSDYGAYGANGNGNHGFFGSSAYGVYGAHNNGNYGYLGSFNYGVYGRNDNENSYGILGTPVNGVFGSYNSNYGRIGGDDYGVYGENENDNHAYLGHADYGVYGENDNGNHGAFGGSIFGARGWNENDNRGYLGHDDFGIWGTNANGGWAGYFVGPVYVNGILSKAGGSFKIDHPLDPAGKYLSHSFVESPDMMNVYNGNVTTDAAGEAVVELPSYFEALNRDFRYQLTVIGTFAQAIIAAEIDGNRFAICTDQPGVKVSWQVTGIRQDPWANENRIIVEEAKPAEERGSYLHPQLYGQAKAQGIGWIEDERMSSEDREAQRRRMEQEYRQIEQEHRSMEAERERMKTGKN